MDRRHFIKSLATLAACPVCAPTAFAADWSYEGAHGPDHWGEVDAASKVCSAGTQQSPIDIGETTRAHMPPLNIAWGHGADTIVNNGHTIQLNFAEGSGVTVGREKYKLLQVHFHRPSEHLIG